MGCTVHYKPRCTRSLLLLITVVDRGHAMSTRHAKSDTAALPWSGMEWDRL